LAKCRLCKRYVVSGPWLPFLRCARARLCQVSERQPCPDEGPRGAIEVAACGGRRMRQFTPAQEEKTLSEPRGVQPFALKIERGDFSEGIEQGQIATKFKTVDDRRPWQQTDVLGPPWPLT